MRGKQNPQGVIGFFLVVEDRIPKNHPLRAIRKIADEQLARISPDLDAAYAHNNGRPSVPPEQIIKAFLLQALYSIRSERQLCEQIGYNILFQWFLRLKPDDPVWDHSTFTHFRDRFAVEGILQAFFDATVTQAIEEKAANCAEFAVDGTLIQSLASIKSFIKKDAGKDKDSGDPPYDSRAPRDFRGEKLSNGTHRSATDPEARLVKKSKFKEAKLSHSMHILMDSEADILMGIDLAVADGYAERKVARRLLQHVRRKHKVTPKALAADAGYRGKDFREAIESKGIELDVAPTKKQALKQPRTDRQRHLQRMRRRVEKPFSWLKGIAGLARARFFERWKTKCSALLAGAAYNLLRLVNRSRALAAGAPA
jgi:transposase